MSDHCDASIRASTHPRDPATCQVQNVFSRSPFYTENASFCQDRLGTNIGKNLRKSTPPPRSCHACQPDSAPKTGCCCYPGCDQGKCSSFKFERNIVYQPQNATGIFVGTGFAGARTSALFGTILRQTIVKADLLLVTKTGSGQTNKQNGNLTKEGRRFDSRSCAEGLDNFTFGKNLYWDGNASAR